LSEVKYFWIQIAQKYDERVHQSSTGSVRAPNPNNPSEYCSTLPPQSQVTSQGAEAAPLSVMVPTGVLRKRGKRMMFNFSLFDFIFTLDL